MTGVGKVTHTSTPRVKRVPRGSLWFDHIRKRGRVFIEVDTADFIEFMEWTEFVSLRLASGGLTPGIKRALESMVALSDTLKER